MNCTYIFTNDKVQACGDFEEVGSEVLLSCFRVELLEERDIYLQELCGFPIVKAVVPTLLNLGGRVRGDQ